MFCVCPHFNSICCQLLNLKRYNCNLLFSSTICILQDLVLKRETEIGKQVNGLYLLHTSLLLLSSHQSSSVPSNALYSPFNKVVVAITTSSASLDVWNARLGHVLFSVTKHITLPCTGNNLANCDICHHAKQTRSVFPLRQFMTTNLLSLIHCDVWGPISSKLIIIVLLNYCWWFFQRHLSVSFS